MSDEERESMKAELVEGVRQHLQSAEKKKFALSVGTALTVVIAIISGTWVCNNTLRDLKDGQTRVELSLNYKVNDGQFRAWTYALDRANRATVPGLVVPEVPQADPPHATAAAATGRE